MTLTGIISSSTAFAGHDTTGIIPELPTRASVIHDALWNSLKGPSVSALPVSAATDAQLRAIHPGDYLERLQLAQGSGETTGDNPFLPETVSTARIAAGSVIAAVQAVMAGEVRNAFCAVRPPGHHAFPDHWEGFCYLNNVAVAARYLLDEFKLSRVLILDWDLHHGNGTQNCFYDDPRVLVVNLHGDPRGIYPYRSGYETECGVGAGAGFNLNIALPPGSDGGHARERFLKDVLPKVTVFKPEFVLISAGFDAHRDDPFKYLRWDDETYRWLTEQTLAIAAQHAQGRYVSVLEGGYNLDVLQRVVPIHVKLLTEVTE